MQRQSPIRAALSQSLEDKTLVSAFFIGILLVAADLGSDLTSPAPSVWSVGLNAGALVFLAFSLGYYLFKGYRNSLILYSQKPVPLVFAVACSRHEAQTTLNSLQDTIRAHTGFNQFRQVEQHFNVRYESLLAHRPETLPNDPRVWHEFLEESQQDVRQFLEHVPGPRVYHVAVRGPASLALGVGSLLGTRVKSVAYHHDGSQYHPVIDLLQDTRQIKTALQNPEDLQYISVRFPKTLAADTAVVLDLAGHVASGHVQRYLSLQEAPIPLVQVSNTYNGHLQEESWTPVVREIFTAFSRLQREPIVERIHLFHSMPIGLALGVGMALGAFVPVTVYNWDRDQGTYYAVLRLNGNGVRSSL